MQQLEISSGEKAKKRIELEPEDNFYLSDELKEIIDPSYFEAPNKITCNLILQNEESCSILEFVSYSPRPKLISVLCPKDLAFQFIENEHLLKRIELRYEEKTKQITFDPLYLNITKKNNDNEIFVLTFSNSPI